MANDELVLLSKVLEEQDIRPLTDANITLNHFQTEDGQLIYRRITRYYKMPKTAGLVPSREYIEKNFPTVTLPKPPKKTTLKALVEEFLQTYLRSELQLMADRIVESLASSDNPDTTLDEVGEKYLELSAKRRISEDQIVADIAKNIKERYDSAAAGGLTGIPYPWDHFNLESTGFNNGEFVLLYGRPKSMKTWILLVCACHAYDFANRRVLICTREMKPEEIADRCICLLIEAPYRAFKRKTLDQIPVPEGGTMYDRFARYLDTMKIDENTCRIEMGRDKSLIITSDRADPNGGGVSGLRQKIRDHRPDALYVDGLYLMRHEGRRSPKWNDQTAIAQDIRDLALDENLPIMGTNQANRDSEDRGGKSASNISYADAYGQSCTTAIEIMKKTTPDPEVNELALAITVAREMNITGFAINGNPATDFGCLMTKQRNLEGNVVVDEDGNPVLTPLIFQEYSDLKNFFKEEEERPRTKSKMADHAREAWRELKGRKSS